MEINTETKPSSYVFFPFLKTTKRIKIGTLEIRSTDDVDGLTTGEIKCVSEISGTMFLRDNFRIKSCSYAIIPFLDLSEKGIDVTSLTKAQAILAYFYANPRHESGSLFFYSEHASIAILTPSKVSKYLMNQDFHVESIEETVAQTSNNRSEIDGYAGLYNFRHHFWITKESRLYGPIPRLSLNQSQDLFTDLEYASTKRIDYRLLLKIANSRKTEFASRVFTSLDWFNSANKMENDQAKALVNLAIAFESLLRLPQGETTARIVEAVSLLLGRISRLNDWAEQFYNARSRIVHEGRIEKTRFHAGASKKDSGQPYQSLLSYGRQIFQLCLGTLLVGSDLSEKAGLEEALVTNQERFVKICTLLEKDDKDPCEQLEKVAPLIIAIDRYQYVPEEHLEIDTMLGAIRKYAKILLKMRDRISSNLLVPIEAFVESAKTKNELTELGSFENLVNIISDESEPIQLDCGSEFIILVRSVWDSVFQYFYWIKKKSEG